MPTGQEELSLTTESAGALYERAVQGSLPTDAVWQVAGGRTFFAGPLFYNSSHEHGAPVYLAGLYGSFALRINGGPWQNCRSAMIPAGVQHELDVGGNPISVLYLEPDVDGASAFAPLVAKSTETQGCLVGQSADIRQLREVYEDPSARARLSPVLDDLIGFGRRRARREVDPRIARAIPLLSVPGERMQSVGRVAAMVGLSPSRFQHLFTREVGVPFRRYRAWQRMRAAIGEIVDGNTFSRAANAAGFADQAHFAHDFKRTFGAPAGISLSRVRA